jgi:hypothetical protein
MKSPERKIFFEKDIIELNTLDNNQIYIMIEDLNDYEFMGIDR